ncbi:hypothetical protein CR205_11205 [Alteribacter lacisalsi]|uniref:Uncharacterized protein n=1 Tax=Alteribacter lacisalsi TaxID=2045244 RepID=A0A2W0HB56_9BACI|nr:hypothetical protein [Alteribacter lacisalsi]PYZ99094.1 hypothetical protein CR205_11205 [Alteribacter lacisalsi]
MHKLQFVDAYTQDIIREESSVSKDNIEIIFNTFKQNDSQEVNLMDGNGNILRGTYVTANVIESKQQTLYKLFFQTSETEYRLP